MNENNKDLVSQEFLDLIDRLLRYDHQGEIDSQRGHEACVFRMEVAVS